MYHCTTINKHGSVCYHSNCNSSVHLYVPDVEADEVEPREYVVTANGHTNVSDQQVLHIHTHHTHIWQLYTDNVATTTAGVLTLMTPTMVVVRAEL